MTIAAETVAEHDAVLTAVGLVERAAVGVVQITGRDCASFLHGLLSSDVQKLPVGRGQVAFFLNTTGHVVGKLTLLHSAERILALTDAPLAARIAADFEKLHFAEKVTIEDRTAATCVIGVHGPAAGDVLNDAFSVDVAGPAEFQHFELMFDGAAVVGAASRRFGVPGFDFLVPADRADAFRDRLRERGAEWNLRTVGEAAQEVLRVEAGIAAHPNELNESVLGPELNMSAAFARGKCYPGQEVVARIEARGHINKSLTGLRIVGEVVPSIGDEVRLGERKVATITSAVMSVSPGGPLAMGFVRREAAAPGTAVQVLHAGAVLPATVEPLPFRK